MHRKRELYEKCTPCYRHNAYQAYGIEDPPPGAAGSILILWRDPALRGRNAGGRAIVDHGWLVEGLRERFGAARLAVHYGNESAEATVRLFAGAQVVVGYHGAGMVNAVFCRQGTLVVEVTTFADAAASHSLQIWRANMPAVYHGLGLDFSLHLVSRGGGGGRGGGGAALGPCMHTFALESLWMHSSGNLIGSMRRSSLPIGGAPPPAAGPPCQRDRLGPRAEAVQRLPVAGAHLSHRGKGGALAGARLSAGRPCLLRVADRRAWRAKNGFVLKCFFIPATYQCRVYTYL